MLDDFLGLMAEKRKTRWSQKDLVSAIQAIKRKISLRTAAGRFGMPKSTLNKYIFTWEV